MSDFNETFCRFVSASWEFPPWTLIYHIVVYGYAHVDNFISAAASVHIVDTSKNRTLVRFVLENNDSLV